MIRESARLRVGIVGAGSAGRRHALAYRQLPDVSVAAIVDPDETRTRPFAAEIGAEYLAGLSPTFWREVDAVSVCVPHAQLAAIAREVIDAGKPLLLEKPMALTLADADEVITAADRAGVRLMIGFVHRFRAEVQAAHRRLEQGFIGRPTFAVEHLISGGGTQPGWIWRKDAAGGGVVLYNGVHGLDRLRWFVGSDVIRVFAEARTVLHHGDVEDLLVGTLTFASGVVASFVQHIATYPLPSGWRSEIYGSDGALLLGDGSLTASNAAQTTALRTERDDRFLGEVTEFVAAIREERAPAISGTDGRAALATALALYRSAATGQPVSVDEASAGGGEPARGASPYPT